MGLRTPIPSPNQHPNKIPKKLVGARGNNMPSGDFKKIRALAAENDRDNLNKEIIDHLEALYGQVFSAVRAKAPKKAKKKK